MRQPARKGMAMLKVTTGRYSTEEMDLVRTTRACGQARISGRAGLAELDVPVASGEALRGGAQGDYGTEICGVPAGANSLRKRS